MKDYRVLIGLVVVLALGLLSPVYADQAGVLAKVGEAEKAEGDAAATALTAAAGMVTVDCAGAGDYGVAMAKWVASGLEALGVAAKSEKGATATGYAVAKARVKDLYGALVPLGKGDLAGAGKYVKAQADAAAGPAQEKLAAAAKALSDGADGAAAKGKAALVAAYLYKAVDLIGEKEYKQGSAWVITAASFLKSDPELKGPGIADVTANLRAMQADLAKGVDVPAEDVVSAIADMEATVAAGGE